MNKKNLFIVVVSIVALGFAVNALTTNITIDRAKDDDDYVEEEEPLQNIEVVTTDATNISTLFATLNGELVDMRNYSSVEVYFVWGDVSGEYTNETAKQTMTSPGEFSAEITGVLLPDNTYYFQARSDPEGKGEELSFYVN